jgi:hypothetical protein
MIGYILMSRMTNKPLHGTRRFKVWTTQAEALSHTWVGNPDAYVTEVYVEVGQHEEP